MVGEVQQRVEKREWRVGLNKDRRFLQVWIFSFSPEIIVTLFGREERDSTARLMILS